MCLQVKLESPPEQKCRHICKCSSFAWRGGHFKYVTLQFLRSYRSFLNFAIFLFSSCYSLPGANSSSATPATLSSAPPKSARWSGPSVSWTIPSPTLPMPTLARLSSRRVNSTGSMVSYQRKWEASRTLKTGRVSWMFSVIDGFFFFLTVTEKSEGHRSFWEVAIHTWQHWADCNHPLRHTARRRSASVFARLGACQEEGVKRCVQGTASELFIFIGPRSRKESWGKCLRIIWKCIPIEQRHSYIVLDIEFVG